MRRILAIAVSLAVSLAVIGTLGWTSSTHAQKTGGEFAVTAVDLKANEPRFAGPCPTTLTFRGYITTNGPGRVEYTFTRSDGAVAPVYTLEFKDAGTQEVSTTWGPFTDNREGWPAIKVLSPNSFESNHAMGSFSVH
jgi:hypothetical protein